LEEAKLPGRNSMKPVWIKYCGLIWMTKRGYLIALAVGGFFAIACFAIVAAMGRMPPPRSLWEPVVRGQGFGVFFVNNLYRILILLLIAQAIDTFVVLRKFAKKEAEQRAEIEAAAQQTKTGEKPSEAIMEKHTGITEK
jgi:hypothetical protein